MTYLTYKHARDQFDDAVDAKERLQQAAPRIVTACQNLFFVGGPLSYVTVSARSRLRSCCRTIIAQQRQLTLFGTQKHQPHHHGYSRFVQCVATHAGQKLAAYQAPSLAMARDIP